MQTYVLVLTIFTAILAVSVLLQAGVLLGMFIVMRKSAAKIDEVKDKALPALATTRSLLEDLAPKLKSATADLSDVAHTLKNQTDHVSESLDTLLQKTNAQMNRVDGMVTATFDALDHASKAVESAVATPMRRFNGVINGVRAGVGVFVRRSRNSSMSDGAPPNPDGPAPKPFVAPSPASAAAEPKATPSTPESKVTDFPEQSRVTDFPGQKQA